MNTTPPTGEPRRACDPTRRDRLAAEEGRPIVEAAGIDVGAVEHLQTRDGRRVFDDVNANSNLRASVAETYGGFDPFERVVDRLEAEIEAAGGGPQARIPA